MRRAHPIAVLGTYILAGPIMGAFLVALGTVIAMGWLFEPQAASVGLSFGVIYGSLLGLVPAIATAIAHLLLQPRVRTQKQLITAVCATGVGVTLVFLAWLYSDMSRNQWPVILGGAVAAAVSTLTICWWLTRERVRAT